MGYEVYNRVCLMLTKLGGPKRHSFSFFCTQRQALWCVPNFLSAVNSAIHASARHSYETGAVFLNNTIYMHLFFVVYLLCIPCVDCKAAMFYQLFHLGKNKTISGSVQYRCCYFFSLYWECAGGGVDVNCFQMDTIITTFAQDRKKHWRCFICLEN